MNEYIGARWGEGRLVEFKRAIHVYFSGYMGCVINHGLGVDIIYVVLVNNNHALMTGDAGCNESTGGVGVNHASGGVEIRVHVSCAAGWWLRRCSVKCGFFIRGLLLRAVLVWRGGGKERRVGLHGSCVHAYLVQVALVHGHGGWWVLSHRG
jgi:hypothetical protein